MKIGDYLRESKGDSSPDPNDQQPSPYGQVFVLTHKNCPDGCAFVVLAKTLYEQGNTKFFVYFSNHENINKQFERIQVRLGRNPTPSPKPKPPNLLLVGDISPSKNLLSALVQQAPKQSTFVRVYDHHKTSEWLTNLKASDNLNIVYDEGRSASKIFFDEASKTNPSLKPYESFVDATNDRDLWLKKNPMSTHIATLHQIYGDKLYVERFANNPVLEPTRDEKVVVDYHKRQEGRRREALLSRVLLKTDNKKLKYGLIYGEGNSSDVLNEALERFQLDYALLVNLNTQKVSVRSKGKFDCAAFAAKYNGGGHKRASGFTLKNFVPPSF